MQLGSLEHAIVKIEEKQRDLALRQLLTPNAEGKDPAYLLGFYAGRVQGLQMARDLILDILNPPDPEKKRNGR